MGHGGLSRSRSAAPGHLKRTRTKSAGGKLVEVEEDDFEEPWEESIEEPQTQQKYRAAAHVAQTVLRKLLTECTVGASARQLCRDGDAAVIELVAPHFANAKDEEGKKITRGVSFPTTVNVNDIVCNYSPIEAEQDVILQSGDVVRVEVGCHIDGFIGTTAHTIIVDSANYKETNQADWAKKANVLTAAWQGVETILRLMRPGETNETLSEFLQRVAKGYGVEGVLGSVSHRMARFEEMGDQIIMNATTNSGVDTQLQDEIKIRENSVWNLDVCFISVDASRGEDNRLRHGDLPPTIFKRTEVLQALKFKASHYVLKYLRTKGLGGVFPFAVHELDNIGQARFGLSELIGTQLVDPMPVLYSKPGQIVARYKFTVYVHDDRVERVAFGGVPEDLPVSSYPDSLPEVVKDVLRTPFASQAAPAKQAKQARKRRKMEE